MIKITRYSGSKTRLLKFLPQPPEGTRRIVEPYAGSLAYSLNSGLPFLAYEINPKVAAMYDWLRYQTSSSIAALPEPIEKVDIRSYGWSEGQNTYYQLNGCSTMLGQLSSWTFYPQHNLPKEKTVQALSYLANGEVVCGDCHELYDYRKEDFLFVDPPYVGTSANYIGGEESYHPEQTREFLDRMPKGTWAMTYSSRPKEFADYQCRVLCKVKVPNIRKGGTTERTEYLFTS